MQSLDSSFENLGRICDRGDISIEAILSAYVANNTDAAFNLLYFKPCLTNDCTSDISTGGYRIELAL